MYWDKKIETLKPADLQALQLKRLKKTLKQVENVGFYKKRLAEAGVKTSSIKTLDDIRKVPFTRKQDLRDGYPFGFLAVPLKKVWSASIPRQERPTNPPWWGTPAMTSMPGRT